MVLEFKHVQHIYISLIIHKLKERNKNAVWNYSYVCMYQKNREVNSFIDFFCQVIIIIIITIITNTTHYYLYIYIYWWAICGVFFSSLCSQQLHKQQKYVI